MKIMSNGLDTDKVIKDITAFIRGFVEEDEQVVVPVSGGMDSDLVARLCFQSLGRDRVKLFVVLQDDMENKFIKNVSVLADELELPLAKIHLEHANRTLMKSLEEGEPKTIFSTKQFLDIAKAKCSVRSSVISCYQDKGFLIAGCTNRSEKELGFFLTFGDNLAHFKPIAHLYKSQLYPLAQAMGTHWEVLEQEPSAGVWSGQTDLEDLSYWIVNNGPIIHPRNFTEEEHAEALRIKTILSYEKIDTVLELYAAGQGEKNIVQEVELPADVIRRLLLIVEKAKKLKSRRLMQELTEDVK